MMRGGVLVVLSVLLINWIFIPAKAASGELPQIFSVNSLVKDHEGNTFIVSLLEHKIYKLGKDGELKVYAGSGAGSYADGPLLKAQFRSPYSMVVDSQGNLFVSDSGNNMIRKIDPDTGLVSTFAGTLTVGHSDGKGAKAEFNFPVGLAVDARDNLYVTDQRNNLVRKIDKAGKVTTLAGKLSSGYQDGSKQEAAFYYPESIALDAQNNVFVMDKGNKVIRKITTQGIVSTVPESEAPSLKIPKVQAEERSYLVWNW